MTRTPLGLALLALVLAGPSALAGDRGLELDATQAKAAKLAGLAGFVNLSCPEIRTEKDRFRAAIEAMRIDPADLEQGPMRLSAESYIVVYQKDVAGSCRQAGELFGRDGRIIPGLFVSR